MTKEGEAVRASCLYTLTVAKMGTSPLGRWESRRRSAPVAPDRIAHVTMRGAAGSATAPNILASALVRVLVVASKLRA